MIKRVEREAAEERGGLHVQKASKHEPMFDVVHGFPGTGKTQVITWVREYFEKVLGWTHGVQFVCLSFQNVMAALINGETIHHWSGIPARDNEGSSGTRDNYKLSIKCQVLRFLLIDQVSMVSAELLAPLEAVVRKVVRVRSGYKRRLDGSDRPFGGINVLQFVDLWQQRPVGGTAIFSNPYDFAGAGSTSAGLNLFWGTGRDCVKRLWELTELMRCDDE